MQQSDENPAVWEEVPDGYTSDGLGFKAFEHTGTEFTASDAIYSGWVDLCRDKAFFFGSNYPRNVLLEFSETTPSKGDLYAARIFTELVDTYGLVSYSPGATIWAFPINGNLRPTLETLYFAYRTGNEELVDGLAVYEVDRCCDSNTDQSSSGSGDSAAIAEDICTTEPNALYVRYRSQGHLPWTEFTLAFDTVDTWTGTGPYDPFGNTNVTITITCVEGNSVATVTPETEPYATEYAATSVLTPGGFPLAWIEPAEWDTGYADGELEVIGVPEL